MAHNTELDHDKIAEAALALLSLTRHDGDRVWKGLDWSLMNHLHERGWISDPVNKAKSVVLTEKGARSADRFLAKHFSKSAATSAKRSRGAALQDIDAIDPSHTVALRCTAKLLKELKVKPAVVPDTIPVDRQWHATLLRLERRKCVLITHTSTLYSVALFGMRRENFERLDVEFSERVRRELLADHLHKHDRVLPSGTPRLLFAKTDNRSVLGSMNDFTFQLKWMVEQRGGVAGVGEDRLCWQLNRIPMIGTLDGNFGVDAMTTLLTGAERNTARKEF